MKNTVNRLKKVDNERREKIDLGSAGMPQGPFKLRDLPYSAEDLEPYIDARTMKLHHDKHHGSYVANLNKAIVGTEAESMSIEEICKIVSRYPAAVRNNAGGHYNHSMLWTIMSPGGGGAPQGDLLEIMNIAFGSFEEFKRQFSAAGANHFGSGWAWLVLSRDKLVISSTSNQDNPLMDLVVVNGFPLLGMDLWEHAYYLKYQNRRTDYITAFWNVVNWDEVSRRFDSRAS